MPTWQGSARIRALALMAALTAISVPYSTAASDSGQTARLALIPIFADGSDESVWESIRAELASAFEQRGIVVVREDVVRAKLGAAWNHRPSAPELRSLGEALGAHLILTVTVHSVSPAPPFELTFSGVLRDPVSERTLEYGLVGLDGGCLDADGDITFDRVITEAVRRFLTVLLPSRKNRLAPAVPVPGIG